MYIFVLGDGGGIGSVGFVVGASVSLGPEPEGCCFVAVEIDLLSVYGGTYYRELMP